MAKKKIGIALGSGAFRGFAHIGILKKLEENDLKPDYIAGSSIGAWIGAHYALFQDLEKLIYEVKKHQAEKFLDFFSLSFKKGLISSKKAENFLEDHFKGLSFKDCKIPLQIASTDLKNGESYTFTQGKIHKAVRASISVPFVFSPFNFRKKMLVDGALSNPVPIKTVKEMGATTTIGVNLYHKNELIEKKVSLPYLAFRSIRTILFHFSQKCLEEADFVLAPDTSAFVNKKGNKKFFSNKQIDEIIKIGEDEAEKIIKEIKR